MEQDFEKAFYQRTYLLSSQVPSNISLLQVKQIYQPYFLEIDTQSWNKIYAKRRTPTAIEQFYTENLQNESRSIGFNVLLCKPTCPRRYVGFRSLQSGTNLVYSERDSRSFFKGSDTVFLQSLPKMYRSSLIAPDGMKLVDLDLIACHISILAWLSQDPILKEDVLDDCHALVGKLFFPQLSVKNQRKVGKVINTVLPMGGTKYGLHEELNLLFAKLNLTIDFDLIKAESLVNCFWKRYEQANRYRLWSYSYIMKLRDTGEPFKVGWDGRLLFQFGNYVLRGQHLQDDRSSFIEQREIDVAMNKAILGAASAIYRGVERVLIDTVMVSLFQAQSQYGVIRCFCPMYDGALLVVQEGCDLLALSAHINKQISDWFNGIRIKIVKVG